MSTVISSGPVLTAVVIIATVTGATMAVPQAHKILRGRQAAGVSPAWAGISVAVNLGWVVYGIGAGQWAIIPVSGISVVAYTTITVGVTRFSPATPARTLGTAAAAALAATVIATAALVTGGWDAAGITLGSLYAVQLAPAVIAVHRCADPSAVSAATWILALVEAACWGFHSLVRPDVGLLTLGATGVVLSGLVLVRIVVRSRADRHPPIELATI